MHRSSPSAPPPGAIGTRRQRGAARAAAGGGGGAAARGAAAGGAAAAGAAAGGAGGGALYAVEVRAWNEYTARLGAAGADYPWFGRDGYAALVEPHRAHRFAACARPAAVAAAAATRGRGCPAGTRT